MTSFNEDEGLVWLHQDVGVLRCFLQYADPETGESRSFCDAPVDFWDRRGQQKDRPLYDGCRVVFYVGLSRRNKVLFATAKIRGDGSFKMTSEFGPSFGAVELPRYVRGSQGKVYFFPEGIWLTDVQYIEPMKSWPSHDALGSPRGSCIMDGSRWEILKRWIC